MCWCVAGIWSVLHVLPQDITNTIQLFSKKEYDICCGCLYSNVLPYSHCSNIIILNHLIWSFIWFIFFLAWFVAAQQYMRRDKKRRYNSSFKLDWDDEAAQWRRPERKGEMTWRTMLFLMSLHSFYCVTLTCAKPYLPSILIRGLLRRNLRWSCCLPCLLRCGWWSISCFQGEKRRRTGAAEDGCLMLQPADWMDDECVCVDRRGSVQEETQGHFF